MTKVTLVIHQVNIMTKGTTVIEVISVIKVTNVAKSYKTYGLDHSKDSPEKQQHKTRVHRTSKPLLFELHILILSAIASSKRGMLGMPY